MNAWNNHPLTTEGNKSPSQVWIQGLLLNSRSGHTVTEELYSDAQSTDVSLNIRFYNYNTVVSRVSAHGRLNITHDFGPHGRLPGIKIPYVYIEAATVAP